MGTLQRPSKKMPSPWNRAVVVNLNVLPPTMRMSIDAATGGSLMSLTSSQAKTLIENMALNNYLWQSKKQSSKKTPGKLELDVVTLLSSKLDALSHQIKKMQPGGNDNMNA